MVPILQREHGPSGALPATVRHGLVFDVLLNIVRSAEGTRGTVRPALRGDPVAGLILVPEHVRDLEKRESLSVCFAWCLVCHLLAPLIVTKKYHARVALSSGNVTIRCNSQTLSIVGRILKLRNQAIHQTEALTKKDTRGNREGSPFHESDGVLPCKRGFHWGPKMVLICHPHGKMLRTFFRSETRNKMAE